MEKEKLHITYFILIIIFLGIIARSFITEYGTLIGLQCTFIFWSFFVLCIPLARGTILFGVPTQLIFNRKHIMPELLCWCIALAGNIASYMITPSVYYKTNFTLLLHTILTNPWPYWILIALCAFATFFTVFSRKSENVKIRRFGELLVLCSFITTTILAYPEFVVVLNVHGNA